MEAVYKGKAFTWGSICEYIQKHTGRKVYNMRKIELKKHDELHVIYEENISHQIYKIIIPISEVLE